MSSGKGSPDHGCASHEDPKGKKSLKSSVVPDNDPLKIKLKISKRDIPDVSKGGGGGEEEEEVSHTEEKTEKDEGEKSTRLSQGGGGVDPKMKLRSKREAEGESEDLEDMPEEKRRRSERETERHTRKRLRREDTAEESHRRRSRRNEEPAAAQESAADVEEEPKDVNKESFCWSCHKDGSVVKCDTCPRVFHLKCVSLSKDPSKDWICPECSLVLHAEQISTRSEAMKSLSLDQLCTLLGFAIDRMKNVPESEAFWKPVDPKEVPFYDKYITNPMDLNQLERNMKAKMYGSPQAFLADAKWLLHNSIIFNSNQSPLTSTARFLVKICRQEMAEIENCPDCYLNAHTKEQWFIEVCRKPHILIWARLKGFPFWPAKAMSTNLKTQQVDARFFGAHDKAWVPVKECYLYSKNSPQLLSKRRSDLDEAFLEAEGYIKKIRQKHGSFCYAPDRTPFVPELYDKQLQSMIPNYKEEKPARRSPSREESPEDSKSNGKSESDSKYKVKRASLGDASKVVCSVNDYVSEEKVAEDDHLSPEEEIERSLEKYDTHKRSEGESVDDNSTDIDEDASVRIPEHGYSRTVQVVDVVQSSSSSSDPEQSSDKTEKDSSEESNECQAESSESTKVDEKEEEGSNEVSSTSTDLKETSEDASQQTEPENKPEVETEQPPKSPPQVKEVSEVQEVQEVEKSPEVQVVEDISKKEEEKCLKSFENLPSDHQQKILAEAKLLANIDEVSAARKQSILNELGLDPTQVDIKQLAQENKRILETLSKKPQSEKQAYEEISIKSEDFEQYLLEENSEEIFDEEVPPEPSSPKLGSIKVRDFKTLASKPMSPSETGPMLKIMDVQSLKDLENPKSRRKKSPEEPTVTKKSKPEPPKKPELPKVETYDKTVELNRQLRLSDEVSLVMVESEKKTEDKKQTQKNVVRPPRARKSMASRPRPPPEDPPKNINVISVDTENTPAQKSLLKSLCLEEKKPDDTGRKTVLITTSDKGIKNVDVKSSSDPPGKISEVTIEAIKETKGSETTTAATAAVAAAAAAKEPQQKSLTVVNPHLIVTNTGSALGPSNLALAQNNLGQLSLVHLSNLTSGIQTNFINLTNETIGFNSGIGTVYATPGFNADFQPGTATGSVILTSALPTAPTPSGPPKAGKVEPGKATISRVSNTGKQTSGISVKSPASLGLVSPQPQPQQTKLPPLVAIPGEGIPITGDVGPFTAEINKHSIKMAEFMRSTIEEILRELSNQGSLEAKCKLLTYEMEKLQWKHQQEIMELKHQSERNMMELRNTMETEKKKSLAELKAQLELQHQKVISETKRKQWCANCGKEALFYCCWNTSYCDYPCQQQHWPGHMSTCAQLGNNVTIAATPTTGAIQAKTGIKYPSTGYVSVMPRDNSGSSGSGNGSHSGGVFAASRAVSNVQTRAAQSRRSSDPSASQQPGNVSNRPQHYYM